MHAGEFAHEQPEGDQEVLAANPELQNVEMQDEVDMDAAAASEPAYEDQKPTEMVIGDQNLVAAKPEEQMLDDDVNMDAPAAIEPTYQGQKPTVMIIGSIGCGKSLVMQRLSGAQETMFESKRTVAGVTQFLEIKEFDSFKLIDTPGLNDMKIPTSDWGVRFNNSEVLAGSRQVDLNLILFRSKIRGDFSDFNILAVLKNAMENLNPENTAIIFTFADQD